MGASGPDASDSESWHGVLSDERQADRSSQLLTHPIFFKAFESSKIDGRAQAGPVKNEQALARLSAHAAPCAKPPASPPFLPCCPALP
eukprot:scaffold32530_cov34-Phaeocystis_antarctica.AAC.1